MYVGAGMAIIKSTFMARSPCFGEDHYTRDALSGLDGRGALATAHRRPPAAQLSWTRTGAMGQEPSGGHRGTSGVVAGGPGAFHGASRGSPGPCLALVRRDDSAGGLRLGREQREAKVQAFARAALLDGGGRLARVHLSGPRGR